VAIALWNNADFRTQLHGERRGVDGVAQVAVIVGLAVKARSIPACSVNPFGVHSEHDA
jgi:hypothetical protein